ncbi:6807_t:CDS:1 [Funneliformis geosporum]|uniref:6807_t:CDS:1 n=1 Tax=Funneliformis geosporum TaxID=1117311 RepID=A0A9W4SAE7_9GLOM|nr:6807_t:CDS:1 [Funneliformis geosporum]
MTKQALQKELLEKVKPGAKPSDIKRRKSAGDIPSAPPLPNLAQENKQLKAELAQLKATPPNLFLSGLLDTKQRELEKVRKESETKSNTIRLLRENLERDTKEQEISELKSQLKATKQQLDNSLEARTKALSDFAKQYEKTKQLATELEQTINQASAELNQGDSEITHLRTKLFQATQQASSLQRELNLNRINRHSSPSNSASLNNYQTKLDYFQYALYALMAV